MPKLKFEHIYLSSFSKMRVDLAAQVRKIISTCTVLVLVYTGVNYGLYTCMSYTVPVHLYIIIHLGS